MRKPVIIAAFALGLFACKSQETPQTPYGEEPAGQDQTEELGLEEETEVEEEAELMEEEPEPGEPVEEVKDVVDDPQYGERITVEGEVDTVYSNQAFTMKAGIFRDNLLVVAPKDIVLEALVAPDEVRVVGTVKQMVVSEVEREFAIDFDNAVEVKWESQPYLAAESIERLPD